jgi:dsRNA-specific ribonuclease
MDLTLEDGDLGETPDPDLRTQSSKLEALSPPPEKARQSAKLAALHARLALPKKLPLETIARTLVDPSADPNTRLNNLPLSQVGGPILSYHVAEWLLCHYPRLPMTVLFAAAYAYNGPKTLQIIAKEWGVETAFAPGPEVDPGLLQFSKMKPGTRLPSGGGSTRPDKLPTFRRGISSRNVYDDEFGDTIPKEGLVDQEIPTETAYANFVKAVIGSIYLHAGRTAAKTFVKQHVLSRTLQISSLFRFENPVRELARLCAREDFEFPVARILSETGRASRTPVYVVGIFSGSEKLGEGAGPSLDEARTRASIAALKAWYLYSPGNDVRVPSDMEEPDAKPWEPVHIDLGEIIH